MTRRIICSDEMKEVWESITPPLRHEDIEKLAVGQKKASDLTFSDWEAILSEIIVGDAFGVDRMDYLLRDAYHAGVAYGRFDHYRLVDTLRILPSVTGAVAWCEDGAPSSSLAVSSVLKHLPIISVDYVFVARSVEEQAQSWLDRNRQDVIQSFEEESVDG